MADLELFKSVEILTLLETPAQVHWFVENKQNWAIQGVVLAITPGAAYACQKLDQPYLKIEDCVQILDRMSEYDSVLFEYLRLEEWLNGWAQSTVPQFGAAGFKPASGNSFLLERLFTEIWVSAINLDELLATIQPKHVALWSPKITGVPWYLHPTVSALPALLPSVARRNQIGVIDLSARDSTLSPISSNDKPLSGFRRFIWWGKRKLLGNPTVAELITMRRYDIFAHFKQFLSDAPNILMSGYGYDLMPLAGELRRRGCRVTRVSDTFPPVRLINRPPIRDSHLVSAMQVAGEQLLNEPKVWLPLQKWGIGRTPLWSKPLDFWWNYVVPELWLKFQSTQQLLEQRKFSALVTWDNGGGSLSGAAVNAAFRYNLPRYIYQHGSSSGTDPRVWHTFLRHSETFLVYGQGTVTEVEHNCPSFFHPRAQLVPVGSSRLDLLRKRCRPAKTRQLRAKLQAGDKRPLIMYVPTNFGGYGRAVSEQAAYPDVSYLELQQTILKLWAETPNVRLLYKDFVTALGSTPLISDFILEHIPGAIVTRQYLTSLMWAVDAIVVDHTITALGELLLTRKPLVVYMPNSNPQAKTLLQKRASVAETPLEFTNCVRALLRQGSYTEIDNPNTEFLQAYSTHLDDGRSAKRAADVILQAFDKIKT